MIDNGVFGEDLRERQVNKALKHSENVQCYIQVPSEITI
jgi:hypothetical protein